MRGMMFRQFSLLASVLVGAAAVAQDVITFETLPDGSTPVDNTELPLGTGYTVDLDGSPVVVTFGFDIDGDGTAESPAVFEAVGSDPVTGFSGVGDDGPALEFAEQMGSWFLRSLSALNDASPVGVMVIGYSVPVPGCAGEIWDIDGPEQWEVRGYRAGEIDPVQTILSPPGGLDAAPWVFSFADPGVGISRVEIEHVGTRPNSQLGLAFNNFSASASIPGPTLMTTQPRDPVRNADGFETVELYWSEAVVLDEDDVSVVTDDVLGLPVPIDVQGSGTRVSTIVFRGPPGGTGGGANDPILNNAYRITVGGLARAMVNNVPIDGDGDGIAGGEAGFVVRHVCLADVAEPFGLLDLSDITGFIGSFNGGCE